MKRRFCWLVFTLFRKPHDNDGWAGISIKKQRFYAAFLLNNRIISNLVILQTAAGFVLQFFNAFGSLGLSQVFIEFLACFRAQGS
jgi:hypothetical protein